MTDGGRPMGRAVIERNPSSLAVCWGLPCPSVVSLRLLFRSRNYRSGQGMGWGGAEVKWVRYFRKRWLSV